MKPTIEELRGAFRYTIKCLRCGCEVVLKSPQAMNRKYCDDCQKVVYAEMRKKANSAYNERNRTERCKRRKKKPRVSQIETINDAARKAGMSYGQYQALKAMGRV